MESQGLISVIIPVYNVEQYIRECINSVLCQTYWNFEIILIDDGATDNSSQICNEFSTLDSRICCIHKKNGGASTARNIGLDAAQGEYIYFLDSDDWLEPQILEKMQFPIDQECIDFSFCEAYAVNEETGDINLENYAYHRNYGTENAQKIFSEMVNNKEFHVSVWMLLYCRSFLQRNNLRFVEKIMYEDCIFTYRVYKQAIKATHIHEYLYHRRYRRNSVMTSKKTTYNFLSAKCAYEELVLSLRNYEASHEDKLYVSRIAHNAIDNYRALTAKDKRKYATDYSNIKHNIFENNAFSDNSLKAKCYGKHVWIIYKIVEKFFS